MAKKRAEKIDGISPKDIERIRRAVRQVWSWSTPRRICIERATDAKGFGRCELCNSKVPKLFADHKLNVGEVDAGFIERMFVPSKYLQALCKKCHDKKTRDERAQLKRDREAAEGFY